MYFLIKNNEELIMADRDKSVLKNYLQNLLNDDGFYCIEDESGYLEFYKWSDSKYLIQAIGYEENKVVQHILSEREMGW